MNPRSTLLFKFTSQVSNHGTDGIKVRKVLISCPNAPWCWNIYLHDWAIFGVNVVKYASTMEHLGCTATDPKHKNMKLVDFGGKNEAMPSEEHVGFPDGWVLQMYHP
jgi:hypothetical protein